METLPEGAPWPTVPDCHGWLELDRRGVWRMKGEPVRHEGLQRFISANYGPGDGGAWVVRNGPQNVYVSYEYTPWVWRIGGDGSLVAHTGATVGEVKAAFLDEEGSVLLETGLGLGLLDDRDLAAFLAACRSADGAPAGEDALLGVLEGQGGVRWRDRPLTLLRTAEIRQRYPDVRPPQRDE
jgi:hypothetical protein